MRSRNKVLIIIALLIVMLGLTACGNKADKVIIGDIYTGDENNPSASAMAIQDGKIIFVGDEKDVQAYIGDSTEVTKYKDGELITAGLSDGHTHVTQMVTEEYEKICDIEDGATQQECIDTIEAFIKENPNLEFITAKGWNDSAFPETGPTAEMLDAIDTDKPIAAMSSDGHSYWVNSACIQKAGITDETIAPVGGLIVRDKNGKATGLFKDTAKDYIDKIRPAKADSSYEKGIAGAEALNIEEGYVIRFQAGDNEGYDAKKTDYIDHCEELDKAGELTTYTSASFQINNTDDALDLVDKAVEYRDSTAGGNYEVTTVKVYIDGIIENEGAWLSEPYTSNPINKGTSRWPDDESLKKLGKIIAKANTNGMSVHFHVMGDQAVSDALTAIAYAADEVGIDTIQESRNALVHLALVKDEDIEKFAKYNVIAVFNPWCTKNSSYFAQQVELLGEERANNQYPMKSFIDKGVNVAFGTDLGASFTYDSIECFHALCTRRATNDDPSTELKASEKLTREQALNAMTKGVAYQLGKEDTFGTIAVGMQANVTVFDQNLLTIEDNQIMNTKVLNCMYNGSWLKSE